MPGVLHVQREGVMSAKVSLLAPVKLGSFNYLFVIVGWNDYLTHLKEEMAKQLDAFGADLRTSGLATYARDLPQLFHKLAMLSRAGEDVFEYMKRLALKNEAEIATKLGRIARYFELKPRIFGVSIDIGKILEDVSKASAR